MFKSFLIETVKYYEKKPSFVVGGFSASLTAVFILPHCVDDISERSLDILVLSSAFGLCGGVMEYLTPPYLKWIYPCVAFLSIGGSVLKALNELRKKNR